MKKEIRNSYIIGIFNGIVFTFAFLFFIVGMDEEFHFMDSEDASRTDTIALGDLSLYSQEDIEDEYLKRHTPEHIMDMLLHHCSMSGTIWEDKWDNFSDQEKVKILLDTVPHCTCEESESMESKCDEIVYRDQAELNEIHGNWYFKYNDSIEKSFQELISVLPEYKNELLKEKAIWLNYQKAVRDVAGCEDHGSSTSMYVDDVLRQGVLLRETSCKKLLLHLKGECVYFSKTIFTYAMIKDAYSAYIKAIGEDECLENRPAYQEVLQKEQKFWNEWMYYRGVLSAKLPSNIKRYYDNCTNMVKRTKLLQLKNQNRALGMCGHEEAECVLPDNASDKALLKYPGFNIVWAKHCGNTDWYPNFE